MSVPYTWEDCLRAHDVAVYDWLGGLHVDYQFKTKNLVIDRPDQPIIRVFSTPQRAYATIVDLLVKTGFVDGPTGDQMRKNAGQFDVLPLPVCTIVRGEPTLDPELSSTNKRFRKKVFDPITQTYLVHPWGGTYRTDYTVTLWAVKRYTDNFMREWVMSYFGANPGASYVEYMLPVQHKAPWGLMHQSFKFTGSSDLSDLEGEAQRYLRVEFSFSLRTWLFRNPTGTTGFVDRIGAHVGMIDAAYGIKDTDETESEETGNLDLFSANLWALQLPPDLIPTQWPRTGVALVSRAILSPDGRRNGLTCTLQADGDSVQILASEAAPNNAGYAIVSVSFQYLSDVECDLQVWQRSATDPNMTTEAFTVPLPASADWKRVHVFALAVAPIYIVSIVARNGNPVATVNVANPDVRQVNVLGQLAPTVIDAGSEWHYVWTNLPNEPVLVVALVTATTGSGNVAAVDNDAVAPTATNEQSVDSGANAGIVALTQPLTTSVRLRVPKAVSLANVGLQRYAGAYNGNEL